MSELWLYPLGTALGSDTVEASDLVEDFGPVRADFLDRTGFVRLHRAKADESGLDLARAAVGDQTWWTANVEGLVYVSSTGDLVAPGNAHLLQSSLGLTKDFFVLDINDACTGFVKSLQVVSALIESGVITTCLLVLSDTYSKLYDPSNLRLSPLFSDGASALIISGTRLEAAPAEAPVRRWELLSHSFTSEGDKASELTITRVDDAEIGELAMNGAGVLNFVLSHLRGCVADLLETSNLELDDVGRWYAHQGSRAVVTTVEKTVKAEPGSLFRSGDYGNTVGSSLPFQLIEDNDDAATPEVIGLLAFGVGLTMAGMLVRQLPILDA